MNRINALVDAAEAVSFLLRQPNPDLGDIALDARVLADALAALRDEQRQEASR